MNDLSPTAQAVYHVGCSFRHLGKAAAALWQSRSSRLVLVVAALAALLAFTGCETVKRWVSPSPVQKLEDAQDKKEQNTNTVLKQGQEYAEAAGKALARDKSPSAESTAASGLLSRANKSFSLALGPVLPARDAYLESLVSKLLSENADLRADGARILAEKDRQADQAAQALAASNAKIEELTGKLATFAAERDATAKKWDRLMFWVKAAVGGWVFFAFILPLIGRAFPAVGAVSTAAQAIIAPFATHALAKTKQVLGDVVGGVHELRTKLKTTGTITRSEADATLKEWVTENDGTAAVVDAIRREKGHL